MRGEHGFRLDCAASRVNGCEESLLGLTLEHGGGGGLAAGFTDSSGEGSRGRGGDAAGLSGSARSAAWALLPPQDEGVGRIPRGQVVSTAKIVVWRRVAGTAFTIVCEPHENLLQASSLLSALVLLLDARFAAVGLASPATAPHVVRYATHARSCGSANTPPDPCPSCSTRLTSAATRAHTPPHTHTSLQLLERPDELLALLDQFLPAGQLLFITPSLGDSLLRDATAALSSHATRRRQPPVS